MTATEPLHWILTHPLKYVEFRTGMRGGRERISSNIFWLIDFNFPKNTDIATVRKAEHVYIATLRPSFKLTTTIEFFALVVAVELFELRIFL